MQTAPFSPTTNATTGNTVKVTANNTPSSVSGSVNCSTLNAESLLVYNAGTVLIFARVSREATPTATAADIPIGAGTFRTLANPNQTGITGVAVLSSTTTSCDVYFTPGYGGF